MIEKPKPECWGTVSNRLVRDENHARMWSGLTDEPAPRPLYTEAQLDAYTAELRAEVERLRADAARYRFLAERCRSTSEHWGGRWSVVIDGPAPASHNSKDDFDAAIDKAMEASNAG